MTYTGEIIFLSFDKDKALVKEYEPNQTYHSKIAFVEGDLSSKSLHDTIRYQYAQTYIDNNGYDIILVP